MAKNRYVPTTEDVSRRYMFGCWEEYNDTSGDYRAEFDRWLAEVRADAWQDGAYHIAGKDNELVHVADTENPYRQGETE